MSILVIEKFYDIIFLQLVKLEFGKRIDNIDFVGGTEYDSVKKA